MSVNVVGSFLGGLLSLCLCKQQQENLRMYSQMYAEETHRSPVFCRPFPRAAPAALFSDHVTFPPNATRPH